MQVTLGTRIKCLVGATEDQNLNDICIIKTVKCHHPNVMSGVLSIVLYIWWVYLTLTLKS